MAEIIKRRRPVVAAFLSLLAMGLGQLYNGQHRRAIFFLALQTLATGAALVFSKTVMSSQGIVAINLGVMIIAVIALYTIADAFVIARRLGEVVLKRYNRWYVYLAILLPVSIVGGLFENPSEAFSIPSGSMKPTMLVGDYLFANKNSYLDHYPKRGDVVVFKLPVDNKIDYLKRIVGMPGDTIQLRESTLYINGKAAKRERVEDFVEDNGDSEKHIAQYKEILPNGVSYNILEYSEGSRYDTTEIFNIPDGHFFTLGDNRDRSKDSRFLNDVGFVPNKNVVGRAEIIYFSHHGSARWWQVWRWPHELRVNRIGHKIHKDEARW